MSNGEKLAPEQALNEVDSLLKNLRAEITALRADASKKLTPEVENTFKRFRLRFENAKGIANRFKDDAIVLSRFNIDGDLGEQLDEAEKEYGFNPSTSVDELVPGSTGVPLTPAFESLPVATTAVASPELELPDVLPFAHIDEEQDPEYFTGELRRVASAAAANIADAQGTLLDVDGTALKLSINPNDAVLLQWVVTLSALRRKLDTLNQGAEVRIGSIEANNADKNAHDTADHLRDTYLSEQTLGITTLITKLEQIQTVIREAWINNIETIHPEFGLLRVGLDAIDANPRSAAPDVLSAHINTLVTAARTAADTRVIADPKFATRLNAYWERAEKMKETLREYKDSTGKIAKEFAEIDEELATIRDLVLPVHVGDNAIEKRFRPIQERLKKMPDGREVREKRAEVFRAEFISLRIWGDWQIEDWENSPYDIGSTKGALGVIENLMYGRSLEIINELRQLGDPRVLELQREIGAFWTTAFQRFAAHVSWMSVGTNILGKGDRKVADLMDPDSFMLTGEIIDALVKGGIFESTIGGHLSNAVMDPAKQSEMLSLTIPETYETTAPYQETAIARCMRIFDEVYKLQRPDAITSAAESDDRIGTHNVNDTYKDLIKYVTEQVSPELLALGLETTNIDNLVLRAFRLHMMITLNHSFLAERSAQITDYLYYLFNWVDYCIKYAFDGTNSFAPMVTYLLFSYEGVDPMMHLFGAKKIEAIRSKMDDKGLLTRNRHLEEETGFGSYSFLFEGPLVTLENLEQWVALNDNGTPEMSGGIPKVRTKTAVFTPPQRYFAAAQGPDGKPARYPLKSGKRGKIYTLDDVRDKQGNRTYELRNFKVMGPRLLEYYNQLNKNGMAFLEKFLKAPKDQFLKTMENPSEVAALKNQGKYSMALFPAYGIEIMEAEDLITTGTRWRGQKLREKLGVAFMNKTIAKLILAKCLIETDLQNDKIWTPERVEAYLLSMANAKVIDHETAEAIAIVVLEGSQFSILARSTVDGIVRQLEKAAEFH